MFSIAFIVRSSFVIAGERFFVLADDPMISMTYARNLSEGHGLVWNPGQPPVEGYTNPLWTVVMAILHLVPLPESKTSLLVMALGAVILAVTVLVVANVAAIVAPGRRAVPAIAAWLMASFWPLVFWTLDGYEVGLLALFVALAIAIVLRCHGRPTTSAVVLLGVVLAAGVLTRLDFLVPAALVTGFLAVVAREGRYRAVLVVGTIVGGALLVHTGVRLIYYGDVLPNTYYLKASGVRVSDQLSRGSKLLLDTIRYELALPLALGGLYFAARRRRMPACVWLLFAIVASQFAYSVYVGGDAWEWLRFANRYVVVAAPCLFLLAALGIDEVVLSRPDLRRRSAALVACVLAVLVLTRQPRAAVDVFTPPQEGLQTPVAVAALLVLLALAAALPRLLRSAVFDGTARSSATIAGLTIAGLIALAVNGEPFMAWVRRDRFSDAAGDFTRYGLSLRAATPPHTTIAVAAAGAIPYFAHRTFIDLLGKNDRFVAHLRAHPNLPPGHAKWDFRYSVGQKRPDVVAELYLADGSDLAAFPGWGYEPAGPNIFVRVDAGVDRPGLARGAAARRPW